MKGISKPKKKQTIGAFLLPITDQNIQNCLFLQISLQRLLDFTTYCFSKNLLKANLIDAGKYFQSKAREILYKTIS